jgi:hypothetical protein
MMAPFKIFRTTIPQKLEKTTQFLHFTSGECSACCATSINMVFESNPVKIFYTKIGTPRKAPIYADLAASRFGTGTMFHVNRTKAKQASDAAQTLAMSSPHCGTGQAKTHQHKDPG